MKADDLVLQELIDFKEGRLSLHGRRLVLHDMHSFAQFRKDLTDMIGFQETRKILTRFGFFWGQADAAALKRIFQWEDTIELLKAGPRLHTLQGVVRSVIKKIELDRQTGKFEMELLWYDSGEAEEHLISIGKSEQTVCWMLIGYASGFASYCLSKEIYFMEQKCRAKGDMICTAIGKDKDSWGDELKNVLPHFESEDIKGKIQQLTEQLRLKSRELSAQRKQLGLPEKPMKLQAAEVRSKSFQAVLELASRASIFDSSILITGETGTGKEVLARYIHNNSPRAKKNFIGVNCGALPETLLESELFGHKAGSFTGATKDRIGLFEQAGQGTIFLDEITEISTNTQVKLLRALQEREIFRVGESTPRKIDIRIIAASNQNIAEAIKTGRFREDLYYRLAVIEIQVPPLRNRQEDILPLARYFVNEFSKKMKIPNLILDASCLNYLLNYSWPGNVRELENAIERAAVFSGEGVIFPENLPPAILKSVYISQNASDLQSRTLEQIEKNHINNILKMTGGNKSRAAKILGISPATLWRKLKTFDIQ
ncbi:MAG: sigma 54-interacting transcriptional regulator [Phycisphaerae bacterium]|jgi:transcriptional regulator with PAS, ATPase and Fis domain